MNEFEAAQFRMSKTVPTEDGHYWYADDYCGDPRIVLVFSRGGALIVDRYCDGRSDESPPVSEVGGYWSQRIPPAVWGP